jgi:hypothetical protein
MVLFAKITPKRIEATSFALLTGTCNLTRDMSGFVGTAVNSAFVGVTKDDLSRYSWLVILRMILGLTPLTYLWLLPERRQLIDEKKDSE